MIGDTGSQIRKTTQAELTWHANSTPEWGLHHLCRQRPPSPRAFKLPLAAVQSVVNQVNHSFSGMGMRKWKEMGEEREKDHQGVGAQTPLEFAKY